MQGKTIALAITALAAASGCAHAAGPGKTDLEIIQSYADDYEKDGFFQDAAVFGVKVGEDFYTLDATPASDGKPAEIIVTAGMPATPTFYFTIESSEYLHKLDAEKVNALTLMAKAQSSDASPMDVDAMEGFQPPAWFGEKIVPMILHFWTRGTPEMVNFANQDTRVVHGANLGVFYYQAGLRSAWIDIRPGQHANEGEDDTSNPFPSMVIMVRGEVTGIIGGKRVTIKEGNMVFIPEGVTHEFINESKENAFGFLLMFGEGA